MHVDTLDLLCDPIDKSKLTLENAEKDNKGLIISGKLKSDGGREYSIINGIPRFVETQPEEKRKSVTGFGDQWNHFNFDSYKQNWLNDLIGNTFDSVKELEGKVIVDCGAGSGMQSRWMAESGAKRVLSLELSHAVDGVISDNMKDIENVDIIQCSIDQPPIKDNAIENGIVICHNVIQHTPSIEKTAKALWAIVGKDGEFVFNSYTRMEDTIVHRLRFKFYQMVRNFVAKRSFGFRKFYSHLMATLCMIPLVDNVLLKSMLAHRGPEPKGNGYYKRLYRNCVLNTFDYFGSHKYQHHMSHEECKALIKDLQPDETKYKNTERYFARPQPIWAGLRIFK